MTSLENDGQADGTVNAWTVFAIFLRLGLTSFGGPVAHLAYFREEFVRRRRWLSEQSYADLVALCQFLPGPASSQVGIAIGLSQAGYAGALAAWTGFTLPSAMLLILFALGVSSWGDAVPTGALHGLKVVAVAVVAQAVWGMGRSLCTDAARITMMAIAACVVLAWPGAPAQLATIAVAGVAGVLLVPAKAVDNGTPQPGRVSRRAGVVWLVLFLILLAALPVVARQLASQPWAMVDAFFRAGSLVFGGGHVVLPLLRAEVVTAGWVSDEAFLAGYGATQAVPGPLFTFAAFLGAAMTPPNGWTGGLLCLLAVFAPSFLLVFAALPFWEALRRSARMQAALAGINAAVVGLLLAALYHPVFTSAIHRPQDFSLALIAFVALLFWRVPPWLVVVASAAVGWLIPAG